MSLYNALFGTNQHADVLLFALGLTKASVPRFRDCYLTADHIVIHTRTGGGNRDYHENEEMCRGNYPDYFKGDDIPTGPWNDDLRAHPCYVRDADDDFDSTYADFYFRFPDEHRDTLTALASQTPDYKPSERWQELLAAMARGEAPARAVAVGEALAKQVGGALR